MRSFLRAAIRHNREYFKQINADSLKKCLRGGLTMVGALTRLGVGAAGKVKEEITKGDFVPNAPSTIARKGSSHPLIHTGQLRQGITFKIPNEGEA
jgi:hypothetical protein